MVIKLNDLALARDLGFVGKDPRGAIAFKFPAQEVTTRLLDIGVNVGRTGVLTPYAMLEPVDIGGVIVKQATLHNFDYIAEKDIRVGDRVRVKRAGEVIPYVIGPVVELRSGDESGLPAACGLPGLRRAGGEARRRGGVVLRQRRLPGAADPQCWSTSSRAARWTSSGWGSRSSSS